MNISQPMVVSFDFDDTLCLAHGKPNEYIVQKLLYYHCNGHPCIIVTARNQEHESEDWFRDNQPERTTILSFLKNYNLPIKKIYFTNHNPKGPLLQNLNVMAHYDDKDEELESAIQCGINAIKVYKD